MRERQSNAANAERQGKELRQQAYLHLLKLKPPPSLVLHASAFVDDLKLCCVVLATLEGRYLLLHGPCHPFAVQKRDNSQLSGVEMKKQRTRAVPTTPSPSRRQRNKGNEEKTMPTLHPAVFLVKTRPIDELKGKVRAMLEKRQTSNLRCLPSDFLLFSLLQA